MCAQPCSKNEAMRSLGNMLKLHINDDDKLMSHMR
jgi:hypothetical protein